MGHAVECMGEWRPDPQETTQADCRLAMFDVLTETETGKGN
jgi:hypothetical protein